MDSTPLLANEGAGSSNLSNYRNPSGQVEISPGTGSSSAVCNTAPRGSSGKPGAALGLLLIFLFALVFLAILVLPAISFGKTNEAWAAAEDGEGAEVLVGWHALKGYKPSHFPGKGTSEDVWVPNLDEDECTALSKSGSSWKAAAALGQALPVLLLIAITGPLLLFACVPVSTKCVFHHKHGKEVEEELWVEACGNTLWLLTGTIWLVMGGFIVAISLLFSKAANNGIHHILHTSINVVCNGATVCSVVRSPEQCSECSFAPSATTCTSSASPCDLVVVDDCEGSCGEARAGWALGVSLTTGVLLVVIGLGLCTTFLLGQLHNSSWKTKKHDDQGRIGV